MAYIMPFQSMEQGARTAGHLHHSGGWHAALAMNYGSAAGDIEVFVYVKMEQKGEVTWTCSCSLMYSISWRW